MITNFDVAVIPAAGKGTRLLPATRSVPKAFVPVVDRPAIQHVVEEAARAGATEIYVVVDPHSVPLLQTHFSQTNPLPGLEHVIVEPVVQQAPRGLGDAVLTAEEAVDSRPFCCLLADNLASPGDNPLVNATALFDGRSLVCLRILTPDLLDSYGVVALADIQNGGLLDLKGAVEKPGPQRTPSRLGIIGRYLFTPEVFDALRASPIGHGDELQLTDAIDLLATQGRCVGIVARNELLDIGTPFGLAHASSVLAAAHSEWGSRFTAAIGNLVTISGSQEFGGAARDSAVEDLIPQSL